MSLISSVGNFFKNVGKAIIRVAAVPPSAILGPIVGNGLRLKLWSSNRGKQRRSIGDCLQNLLNPYYDDIDLSKVKIVPNSKGVPDPEKKTLRAVTIINTIYWNGNYEEDNSSHRKLLAHELVHVQQYQKWGSTIFYILYGEGWLLGGFSYEDNPMEKEAIEYANYLWNETDIEKDFREKCLGIVPANKANVDNLEWLWTVLG